MNKPFFWSESVEAEYWNGPFNTEAEAVENAKSEESEVGGPIDLIWIMTGEELDPASLIDSEWIFEFMDIGGENCPLVDTWAGYWGLDTAGFEELDSYLQDAFRAFAEKRRLRKYYTLSGEPKKVKLL